MYAKRVIVLASALEAVKYLLIFAAPVGNEFLAFLFVAFFYVTMLPEMMIGPHAAPPNKLALILRLVVGVLWNALLIHLVLLAARQIKNRRR